MRGHPRVRWPGAPGGGRVMETVWEPRSLPVAVMT